MKVATVALFVTALASSALSSEDLTWAVRKSINLHKECYLKQAINSLETGVDFHAYLRSAEILCEKETDLFIRSLFAASIEKGHSREEAENAVATVLANTIASYGSLYVDFQKKIKEPK